MKVKFDGARYEMGSGGDDVMLLLSHVHSQTSSAKMNRDYYGERNIKIQDPKNIVMILSSADIDCDVPRSARVT